MGVAQRCEKFAHVWNRDDHRVNERPSGDIKRASGDIKRASGKRTAIEILLPDRTVSLRNCNGWQQSFGLGDWWSIKRRKYKHKTSGNWPVIHQDWFCSRTPSTRPSRLRPIWRCYDWSRDRCHPEMCTASPGMWGERNRNRSMIQSEQWVGKSRYAAKYFEDGYRDKHVHLPSGKRVQRENKWRLTKCRDTSISAKREKEVSMNISFSSASWKPWTHFLEPSAAEKISCLAFEQISQTSTRKSRDPKLSLQ